jgi:hypothetical protein
VTRPTNGARPANLPSPPAVASVRFEHSTPLVPARGFFFVLADEMNPLRQKVVRKVMVSPTVSQQLSVQLGRPIPVIANPERFGLHPTGARSPVSIGRHAVGMKPSPFSSASSSMLGPSRISGSSIREGSVKPIAAETVRQVGGWTAAWAGVKLGAAGGALLGVETGPGAIVSGAVGGLIGGVAGYYGFDWIADHISAN